jgi:hypothetical protein
MRSLTPSTLAMLTLSSILLGACGSGNPVRLIVAVTTAPSKAEARLHCRKEARRETTTPARFEMFMHRTPCKLQLTHKGYEAVDVQVTEEMLTKLMAPRKGEGGEEDEGALRAFLSFLQHGVELMVATGTEQAMTDRRTDVRLHYVLVPSASGRMGDEESLSNRTTSITATADSPATNPHQSPTIPILIENPSSSATGNPSSQ